MMLHGRMNSVTKPRQPTTIAVLGAGSWGTAVGHLLANKGFDVLLWARETEIVESINTHHENPLFQPGFKLATKLKATHDLKTALQSSNVVIIAIPTQYIRQTLKPLVSLITADKSLVSISKGIENQTLMTVSQLLRDLKSDLQPAQISILSGPSFAHEVLRGFPTAIALACTDETRAIELQNIFHTPFFRTYVSHDPLGVELGGAIKNVIAIGVGLIEGLGFGYNARAAMITRALAEMVRLAVKMGGQPQTLSGLSGVGDLILTCTSDLSRNRSLGLKLGKGIPLATILSESAMVVEGVETARSVYQLSQKLSVEMPIVEQVYQVLHTNKSPRQAAEALLSRDPKAEFY